MKKSILLLAIIILSLGAYAGDIIVLTNKTRIDAKILEISDTEVKYKKASNLNGPTFVQKTDQISIIIYENGEYTSFEHKEEAKEVPVEKKEEQKPIVTNTEETKPSESAKKESILKFNPQPSDHHIVGLSLGYVSKTIKASSKYGTVSGSLLLGQVGKVSPAMRVGLTVNPTFKYGIGLRTGLNMEYAREKYDNSGGEYVYTAHDITLSLPLQLSYRYELIPKLSFMFYTGPVFDFGAYLAVNLYDENPSTPLNSISENVYSDSPYIGFNALWGIGAGIQWSHLRLDIGGEFGMMEKEGGLNDDGKWNKPVYVTLTWMF